MISIELLIKLINKVANRRYATQRNDKIEDGIYS